MRIVSIAALKWRSDTVVSELPSDVRSAVNDVFQRLETTHGTVLVQRALGLLTAANNGLSNGEMEDLLSLDDAVLDDVFEW